MKKQREHREIHLKRHENEKKKYDYLFVVYLTTLSAAQTISIASKEESVLDLWKMHYVGSP
jgi:hypothetical protein